LSIGTRKKKVSIAHAEPLSTSRQFSYLKRNSMPNICHVAILIFGRKCTGLIWYFLRKSTGHQTGKLHLCALC
jgi:hypothetical protein